MWTTQTRDTIVDTASIISIIPISLIKVIDITQKAHLDNHRNFFPKSKMCPPLSSKASGQWMQTTYSSEYNIYVQTFLCQSRLLGLSRIA